MREEETHALVRSHSGFYMSIILVVKMPLEAHLALGLKKPLQSVGYDPMYPPPKKKKQNSKALAFCERVQRSAQGVSYSASIMACMLLSSGTQAAEENCRVRVCCGSPCLLGPIIKTSSVPLHTAYSGMRK